MTVLILGADGYLGWPTAMRFARLGYEVIAVDNYLKRQLTLQTHSGPLVDPPSLQERADLFMAIHGHPINVEIGDITDYEFMAGLVRMYEPEVIIHYGEQPSGPYSMIGQREAALTLRNNVGGTLNVVWAMMEYAPACHLIKLGTMGEYGTPAVDIPEGWMTMEQDGREERRLFPREAGSLYHTTKILDTDLLHFYVRMFGLRVTDLMQGPVYGYDTMEASANEYLRSAFHYDDIFGTALNRFAVQAVAGVPLTVYGEGGQTRGYLDIRDTLQCVTLAAENPAGEGELRVMNQFTEQFSVNELASRVYGAGEKMGLNVEIVHIENPRIEAESHHYNADHTALMDLGLEPHYLSESTLIGMLEWVKKHGANIDVARIHPRVRWTP